MAWTEARVRRLLEESDFSYQDIQLPFGLSTGGVDRSATVRRVFSDDMRGRTVLDVGCKFGTFCFEALRRGAEGALGVDVDPESVRKARLLADCLGLPARFEVRDVETEPLGERFDDVLCLNLLHHMRNPIAVLDVLISLTRERLILEVAALGSHDRRKVGVSRLRQYFLARSPVIFVSENGTSGKRSVQKFFITQSALENLLLFQRGVFARVDAFPSEHKDRYLAVAHRRRIRQLVVVSGPTSAGKSTLIERLARNQEPEAALRLGIEDGRRWLQSGSKQLRQLREPVVDRMLFHYDFLRPYLRSAKTHDRDEALDVLDVAERVTFLTIWCPPEQLLRQLRSGEIDRRTTLGVYWGKKRHKILEREYADPARIVAHYRRWFDYTRGRPGEHLVIAPSESARLLSVAEWEELARRYERAA